MPNNVFASRAPVMQQQFDGLPSHVLKGIAATKVTGPEMEAIIEACQESKVVYSCPGVVGDTVLHVTFPKLKAGFLIRSDSSNTWKTKLLKCENMGWTVSVVPISVLRNLTHESIVAQFKEHIASLKINRK